MNIDELVNQFALTDNDREAYEYMLVIIEYFLAIYDDEKESFAKSNNVETVDAYETIKEEYAMYLAELLIGLRNRAQEKMYELSDLDLTERLLFLRIFVFNDFKRLNTTEAGNLKQIAQLQVVKSVQQNTPAARIYKRWRTNSANPCEICRALNGTTIPIDEPFLVNGQIVELSNGEEFIYNYIDRSIAIAHPNDQCSIEFIIVY